MSQLVRLVLPFSVGALVTRAACRLEMRALWRQMVRPGRLSSGGRPGSWRSFASWSAAAGAGRLRGGLGQHGGGGDEGDQQRDPDRHQARCGRGSVGWCGWGGGDGGGVWAGGLLVQGGDAYVVGGGAGERRGVRRGGGDGGGVGGAGVGPVGPVGGGVLFVLDSVAGDGACWRRPGEVERQGVAVCELGGGGEAGGRAGRGGRCGGGGWRPAACACDVEGPDLDLVRGVVGEPGDV